MTNAISVDVIAAKVLLIRGKRVMLDRELAKLYEVDTNQLTRQVNRNIERFPEDFMFQLTRGEFQNLICHFGTSSWGGTRKLPYAFTEQGVAMLSGVLHSKRAIQANIQIMRAFIKFKELLLTHKKLAIKLEALEKKYADHDEKIQKIFEAIRQLMLAPDEPKKKIGFHA